MSERKDDFRPHRRKGAMQRAGSPRPEGQARILSCRCNEAFWWLIWKPRCVLHDLVCPCRDYRLKLCVRFAGEGLVTATKLTSFYFSPGIRMYIVVKPPGTQLISKQISKALTPSCVGRLFTQTQLNSPIHDKSWRSPEITSTA